MYKRIPYFFMENTFFFQFSQCCFVFFEHSFFLLLQLYITDMKINEL